VEGVIVPACAVPGEDGLAEAVAAASPPTGVVPGAGCAAGVLAGIVLDPVVDCAPTPAASASANAASDPALKPFKAALITQPPHGDRSCRFAPLFRR